MIKKQNYFLPIFFLILMIKLGNMAIISTIGPLTPSKVIFSWLWTFICSIATIFIYKKISKYKFQMISISGNKRKQKLIISILICFMIGVAFHHFNSWVMILFPHMADIINPDYYELLTSLSNNVFYGLNIVIIAPIMEEIIFRGYFVTQCRFDLGYKPAIIFGAILWGILHMNPYQFLYSFIMGLVLNIIFIETNSILFTIIIHMGNNIGGVLIPKQYLLQDSLTIKVGVVLLACFLAITGSVFLIKYNKCNNVNHQA